MIAVGLQDSKCDAFTYYGPFSNVVEAREWLEEKHGNTYEIVGNYDIVQILDPELSADQERRAYNV